MQRHLLRVLLQHGLEGGAGPSFLKNSDSVGHIIEISLELQIKCKFIKLCVIFGLPL